MKNPTQKKFLKTEKMMRNKSHKLKTPRLKAIYQNYNNKVQTRINSHNNKRNMSTMMKKTTRKILNNKIVD